jgi:predicted short-subunit dehydrogenase-like oxidoreductase (DUF2520 family)
MFAGAQGPVRNNLETIGLIGAGRLGTALALALERAGHPVTLVASGDAANARALATRLRAATAVEVQAVAERSDLVFLAVPDDALPKLVQALAWSRGQHVVHTSGALGLSVLEPARARGALCGCFHPLQTFPERFSDPVRFAGIACGIEGEGVLSERLERYTRELGATVVRLEGIDRAGYHAAAVFASNYVVALHAAAAQAFRLAGLPPELARAALSPLTEAAAQSVRRLELDAALTGPIARGDVATIALHLHALEQAPELRALYQHLGSALLELPLTLTDEQRERLAHLLSAPSTEHDVL